MFKLSLPLLHRAIWGFVALCSITFGSLEAESTTIAPPSPAEANQLLDQAYQRYEAGERATNATQRKAAFNEALEIYLKLDNEHASGKLLFDIGNTYFQLGEYGLAIYYYTCAEKEMPRDTKLQTNLQTALEKAGLPPEPTSHLSNLLLFWHKYLSLYERNLLLLACIALIFAFSSLYIWLNMKEFYYLACTTAVVGGLLCASIAWTQLFAPVKGVFIQPGILRKDAGQQFALAIQAPIPAGLRVSILSTSPNGDWLKVRLPSGDEGFAPKEQLRVVR